MATDARQRMVEGAALLLAKRGFQGTSFGNVLELSGAPRGSIYYHFPDGKDELVKAALDLVTQRSKSIFKDDERLTPRAIVERFFDMWRQLLVRSGYSTGCAVLGAAVSADSDDVLVYTGQLYREWREDLAARLETAGLGPGDAARYAMLMVASSEGAVVLCRAERSLEPLEIVAADLLDRIAGAPVTP